MFTLLFFVSIVFAIVLLLFFQSLGKRSLFEPGVLIIGLFSLCYLLPALAILSGENILAVENFDFVETVSLYGFLFAVSFVFFYIILKGVVYLRLFPAKNITIDLHPAKYLMGFIFVFVITKIIGWYYGVGESTEYAQQYIVRASMPPLINQTIVFFQCLEWILVCLLLAACFSDTNHKRSKLYIFIMAIIFAGEMWLTNSRSNFVTFCIVLMAAYMLFRRPIGLVREVIIASGFIVIIGLLAFKRLGSEVLIDPSIIDVLIPGEFTSIYSNAIHWSSILDAPDVVMPPNSSYLQSLISFLPKQLNEGKWDLAGWYVTQYFPEYAEAGGGLAFGIIPEAMVNWGPISIVFQAFVIALIFRVAQFSAHANRTNPGNVWVVFYLLCFSQIYQLIRSHSFTIISSFVLGFAVPYVILYFISIFRLHCGRSTNA
ncbi:O-antigen polymerase [Polynucleobacter ibericus]|uniref:O-antigen polymerase n=1 Tax=Polynucleobacter ibericus TaxID=1819725 RepID=UPI001BFD2BEC|nr:O-antigen polymerase [Polynucleobacter ibericus]QWE08966.1 oligosaccharide repeat unit polymerase [Polynucleobacter ibericus]